MTLERLTEKAKEVIKLASEKENLTSRAIIKYISQTEGLGKHLLEAVPPTTVKKNQTVNLKALVKEAYFQAIRLEHSYVGTEHLYLALLKLHKSKHLDKAKVEIIRLGVFPSSVKRPMETHKKTPLLDAFGDDLNHRALRMIGNPLVERDEYEKLVSILLLKDKSNALIVGEEGVGKETLVSLLAHNINSLDVPPALVGYNIRTLNLLSFMTSVANKGGLEFGIATLVDELKSMKRVVLVLNNFQDIFFSTPAGLTIPIFYSILKSYLEETGTSVITFLTPSMYEKIAAENEHIIDNFTVVEVNEPEEDVTKKILKINAKRLEEFHHVVISQEILDYVFEKAAQDIKSMKFPQKALDLLDYSCAYVLAKRSKIPESYKSLVDKSFDLAGELDEFLDEGKYSKALKVKQKISTLEDTLDQKEKRIFSVGRKLILTKKGVDDVLKQLDLGDLEIKDAKSLAKFGKLADKIKKEVIDQDEAVDLVSKALVRSMLGLRSKKRPLGNFLFLGPTGVGKTELAKVLAKLAFSKDSWSGLVRLDMSDFSEKHTVARLVGAPPGYVGYGEGGELTTKIENHPNSVVLFDEIEKAHPDVLNILLQIMEEGELSDARGNVFDFSRAMVILTSNMGTEILHNKGIGFEEKEISDKNLEGRLKDNLKKILKPELINRFDEIVVFKRLTKAGLMKIVNLLLKEVTQTLASQEVRMKVRMPVKKWLIEKGYSKEYGARALRRTIEKELLDKVAQVLLEEETRPLKLEAVMEDGTILIR